jgi:hypothetical protein
MKASCRVATLPLLFVVSGHAAFTFRSIESQDPFCVCVFEVQEVTEHRGWRRGQAVEHIFTKASASQTPTL